MRITCSCFDILVSDWIHDHIKEKLRLRKLRSLRGVRGYLKNMFDGAQAWILVTIIGLVVAVMAWLIDIVQELLTDWKDGFCVETWRYNHKFCCWGIEGRSLWMLLSQLPCLLSADMYCLL
jgi:chloride channel 3/4/5